MRYRIAGFVADMAPGGGISSWPVQIKTSGTAPNRTFITEFNCQRSGANGTYAFQRPASMKAVANPARRPCKWCTAL